jgi:hypothetical protein
MDNRLTFLYHLSRVKWGHTRGAQPGAGHPGVKRTSRGGSQANPAPEAKARRRGDSPEVSGPRCQEKPRSVDGWVLVPQTDTGRRVEDTQANGTTFVKEFGKLAP